MARIRLWYKTPMPSWLTCPKISYHLKSYFCSTSLLSSHLRMRSQREGRFWHASWGSFRGSIGLRDWITCSNCKSLSSRTLITTSNSETERLLLSATCKLYVTKPAHTKTHSKQPFRGISFLKYPCVIVNDHAITFQSPASDICWVSVSLVPSLAAKEKYYFMWWG